MELMRQRVQGWIYDSPNRINLPGKFIHVSRGPLDNCLAKFHHKYKICIPFIKETYFLITKPSHTDRPQAGPQQQHPKDASFCVDAHYSLWELRLLSPFFI